MVLYKRIVAAEGIYFSCDQIDIKIFDGEEKNIKAKVYVKRGEFIFANINILGIELCRAEITPDSIKIINRAGKTYYFGRYEELKSVLKVEISFNQLEMLILKGIVIDKGENKKKIKSHITEDSTSYCLEYSNTQNVSLKSFFNKETFVESGIEILNKDSIFYLKAQLINYNEAQNYPKEIQMKLKSNDYIADIVIKTGKISYSKFERRSFNVNSKYREMSF
jgi:hypothetical protein